MPAAKNRVLWDAFNGKFISMGRDGLVCEGAPGMVVKVPRRHEDDSTAAGYCDTSSVQYFEHERAMAALVNMKPPHPNIIQNILSTSDGVFLPLMKESLKDFLNRGVHASDDDASRWVEQIASAAAWLESMDLFHGDLRPPNILLDADGNIKVCDFGNMERRGQTIHGAMVPYYKDDTAGPASEQYAVGSLMYAIFSGSEPLNDIDDYDTKWHMVQEGKLPSPDHLRASHVIRCCWNAQYGTLAELHEVLLTELGLGQDYKNPAVCLSPQECDAKAAECKAWGDARRAWKAECRKKRMARDV